MDSQEGRQVKPIQVVLIGIMGVCLNLPMFTWAMYHQNNPRLIGKMGILNIFVAVPVLLLIGFLVS